MLLKISQNSLEKNLCRSLFLDKVAGWRSVTLWKKRLHDWWFPVNSLKFLRTPSWWNTSGRLLLTFTSWKTKPHISSLSVYLPAMYYMTLNVLFFFKIVLHYPYCMSNFWTVFAHICSTLDLYIYNHCNRMKSKCIKCTWYFM